MARERLDSALSSGDELSGVSLHPPETQMQIAAAVAPTQVQEERLTPPV